MISRKLLSGSFVRNVKGCLTAGSSKACTSTSLTTQSRCFGYAAVNHAQEYKEAIDGRHGQQLELAYEEGEKYEHGVFDPFEAYKVDVEDDIIVDDGEDSDDEGEEAEPTKYEFNKDGSVKRSKAELVSLKAGAPAGGKFAIIDLNGSQNKVCVDDVVIVNKLRPVEKWAVGSAHTLSGETGELLLMGSQDQTFVGMPFVNGGEVDVMVEEITRDKKVIVFKKKRRKNYRRKNGHKREVTFLRVLDIRFPENS